LFDEVDSPLALLDLLTGVEVLLARVEALGHGGLPAAGFPGRSWTPPLPRSRERRQRKLVTCLLTGRHGNSPAAHGR
ncbi:hypothetical protein ACWCV2_10210, partial [Streptomyces pseudogriseolus]